MKKRNKSIDILKFIFAFIIVFHHAGIFYNDTTEFICRSGYIAVEFYFIVSGYLLTCRADHDLNNNVFDRNVEMIRHKVIHLFPYIFIACIFSNIFYIVSNAFVITNIYNHLLYTVTDMLGLQMAGYDGFFATGVSWYISVLIIVSFIIYPVLCKKREIYTKYFAPIIVCLLLGYICKTSGSLDAPGDWIGVVYKGVIRGFADISAGGIAYELKLLIDKKENYNRYLFATWELIGIVITLGYSIFHKNIDSHDFFIIPLLVLSISILFSNKSCLEKIFQKVKWPHVAELSFCIYLNHFYIAVNISQLLPAEDKKTRLFFYIAFVVLISLADFILVQFLKQRVNCIRKVGIIITVWLISAEAIYMGYQLYAHTALKLFAGNGTEEEPYIIKNSSDLNRLRILVNNGENFSGKYFLQINDIDLNNRECMPIGLFESERYFDGTYNGNNHVIKNVKITKFSKYNYNVGFFGVLSGTVENLGIDGGIIEGNCVGGIASHGGGNNPKIINCYNKALIVGENRAGGICDNFDGGYLIDCVNYGLITAPEAFQICSYNAEKIAGIYPNNNAVSETFTGEILEIYLEGNSISEKLNDGIAKLLPYNLINPRQITQWNK